MQSIVKKQFVQVEGGAVVTPAGALPRPASRPAAPRCEKSVRSISVEGVVRALELVCSCGETTVVELEYPQA